MESLKNFIVENWQYISAGLVVLLEIILMLLKKKTKVIDSPDLSLLSDLIQSAEEQPFKNVAKKNYVIDSYYIERPDSLIPVWMLDKYIEDILTCPTKKGGLGREKDK